MEWKKGKKVLSLFSKSQHMAFVVWLFKVFSFRSAMAGKFMLIVMGKNLTQQHPGARLSEDLNSKWNGRTGFFSSTQQLAADLETPLRCARRAIVSHLLLYDLGAVFRMHTPWHDYFRFWWSSVCVCVRLLHLNAESRISLLSGRLVTWVMMVPAVGPDTVAYLYEKARGKKLSFIKFQRIARAEFSSSKKPPRVE